MALLVALNEIYERSLLSSDRTQETIHSFHSWSAVVLGVIHPFLVLTVRVKDQKDQALLVVRSVSMHVLVA